MNMKPIALMLCATTASAYEVETHGLFTLESYNGSVLGPSNPASADLYFRLGFDRVAEAAPFQQSSSADCADGGLLPTNESYIDADPAWLNLPAPDASKRKIRCSKEYEFRSYPPEYRGLRTNLLGPTPVQRLEAWLMRGAIREDDLKQQRYPNPPKPDVDPWGDRDRVIGHFYVPVSNQPGTPLNIGPGGLRWAMGEENPLSAVSVPDPSRGNHFSYMDARKNFFLALTYKSPATVTAVGSRLDSDVRQNLWASTMLSIGHVVHILQDQASPQHARGEAHNYVCRNLESIFNQDVATRTFENFINYRVTESRRFLATLPNGAPPYVSTNACEEKIWRKMFGVAGQDDPPQLNPWLPSLGNTYPVPKFAVARRFFTTRADDLAGIGATSLAVLNARAGLGDYSNRGFYTEDNMEGGFFTFPFISPPRSTADLSFTDGVVKQIQIPGKGTVKVRGLLWAVPDAVAPGYVDNGLINGKAPIVSYGQWGFFGALGVKRRILTLDNYNQMADMLAPRAIAYTTGLINFFFRGKLTVDPIQQRVFAVMNQGDPHTMNADGYPIRTSNGQIFGFEKIRLRVRNSTDPITESGTNTVVPQTVGTGKLVAVARYHRNPCYKPDLTGERIVDFNNTLTEPNCPQGMRTNYQEISVSAPLTITGNADLPFGTVIGASVEKVFDFASDPIPVNATDLFIQVVYRGQLGEETDGIAVGIIDTQEPTIVGAWNNTDHYYSNVGFNWLIQNGANFGHRGIDSLSICSGSPTTLMYRYVSPQDGLNIPFLNGGLNPGIVRLAMINSKPPNVGNTQPYRMVAAFNASPYMPLRATDSRGQLRQASQEIFTTSSPLPAPVSCPMGEPTATPYWCFDPIKRRRGQPIGNAVRAMYFSTGGGSDGTDVDLPPALPVYSGLRPVVGGTVHFNTDAILAACPAQQQ